MAASSSIIQQDLNTIQDDEFNSKASTELKCLFNVSDASSTLNTVASLTPLITWQLELLSAIESFLAQVKVLMAEHSLPKTPLMISYAVDSDNTVNIEASAHILQYCFNTLEIPVTLCPLSDDKTLREQLKNQVYVVVLCTPAYAKQVEQTPTIKQVLDTFGKTKKNALQTLLCDGGFGDVALKIVDKHYLIRDYKTVLNNEPARKDDPLAQLQSFIDVVIRLSGNGGLGILPDILDLKETKNRQAEVKYQESLSQLETVQQQLTVDYRLRTSLEESTAQHPLKSHLDLNGLPIIKDNIAGFSPIIEELVSTPAKVSLLLCSTKADTELSSLALTQVFLSQQRRVLTIECGEYPGKAAGDCVRLALQKIKLKPADMTAMQEESLLILLKGYQNIGEYNNFYVKNKLSAWKDVKLIVTCRSDFFKSHGYLSCFLADVSNRKVEDVLVHKIPTFASPNAKKASLSITHVPQILDAIDIANLSPKHRAAQFELTTFLKNLNQTWVEKGFLSANIQQNPQIFISYAWETEKTALARQQRHLSRISQDLTTLGFSAWLDIERMSGDINAQMASNIADSQVVLVIGTSRYTERSGQDTNVKKEFDAILAKSQQDTEFKIFPLQFSNTNPFPVALQMHANLCDFTDIDESSDYLVRMTHPNFGLIPRLLGVLDVPNTNASNTLSKKELYQKAYATFQDQCQLLIAKHLIVNQGEGDVQAYDIYNRLKGYIEPYGLYTESSPLDSRFGLVQHFKTFLEKSECKTSVVLGRAGSGKSCFALSMFKAFLQPWQVYQNHGIERPTWLPIYIQLRNYANDPEHIIDNVLHHQFNLGAEEIEALKQGLNHQQQVLFILDGYDELGSGVRPNLTQSLSDWPLAKLLVTGRPEHFDKDHQPLETLCLRSIENKMIFNSAEVAYVSPFSLDEIQRYIAYYNKEQSNNTYEILQKLPGMMVLLDNPFLLTLVLQSLPQLLKNRQEDRAVKRVDIYQAFIETWISQETKGRELNPKACEAFSQSLAFRFFTEKTLTISNTPDKIDLWAFFNNQEHQAVQDASPLRFTSGEYSFIHKSIYEYFVATRLWRAILEPDWMSVWQTRMLTEERRVIDFLVELYQISRTHVDNEARLFQLIDGSKDNSFPVIASSNAITVLNAARVSFSGRDFSDIRIPGADLSGAILDNVNLENADLTHVTLSGAWLHGACFKNTLMVGVIFEQYPSILLEGEVTNCCYSPNGKLLAVAVDGDIELYDAITRTLGRTLEGDRVAFSPDGAYLASVRYKTVELWQVSTGILERTLAGHTDVVTSVAFSSDGSRLASGSKDGTVKLWQVSTGILERTLTGHTDVVTSVAFSPDGARLASASGHWDKTVKLWWVATGTLEQTLKDHTGVVTSVAFSPDGARWASGSKDGTVKLWQVSTGILERTLEDHVWLSVPIESVAFSPDGARLVSGGEDGTVKFWQVSTGTLERTLAGHTNRVTSVAFSPDGLQLASGSEDRTVKLWRVATETLAQTLAGHTHIVSSVAFSPDGLRLASGVADKRINLWRVATGTLERTLDGNTHEIGSLAFSPDGTRLASGSGNQYTGGETKLWRVATGTLERTLNTDYVASVAFSPDGVQIAFGSCRMVELWQVSTGTLARTLGDHISFVTSVAFSLDGAHLASGSEDRTIKLWRVATGTLERTLKDSDVITSISFSPDGAYLASGSWDKTVKLWWVTTGILERTLAGHTNYVHTVAFSPDGKWLASGSEDKTLRLWSNLSLTERTNSITNLKSTANSLSFQQTEKGLFLASGHGDGSVRYWQVMMVGNKPYLQLLHSSIQNVLLSQDADITNVQGLSVDNRDLLKQCGAVENTLLLQEKNDISVTLAASSSSNSSSSSSSPASLFFNDAPKNQFAVPKEKKGLQTQTNNAITEVQDDEAEKRKKRDCIVQ